MTEYVAPTIVGVGSPVAIPPAQRPLWVPVPLPDAAETGDLIIWHGLHHGRINVSGSQYDHLISDEQSGFLKAEVNKGYDADSAPRFSSDNGWIFAYTIAVRGFTSVSPYPQTANGGDNPESGVTTLDGAQVETYRTPNSLLLWLFAQNDAFVLGADTTDAATSLTSGPDFSSVEASAALAAAFNVIAEPDRAYHSTSITNTNPNGASDARWGSFGIEVLAATR